VPEAATLSQLKDIDTMRERLEVGAVMLLQQAGVSWETMAAYSGPVTRQSLHRRMNRKVAERISSKAQERAASKLEKRDGPDLQTDWVRLVEYLRIRITTLEMDRPERISGRIARSLRARAAPAGARHDPAQPRPARNNQHDAGFPAITP
jgi:hypothetical protein